MLYRTTGGNVLVAVVITGGRVIVGPGTLTTLVTLVTTGIVSVKTLVWNLVTGG